MKRLLLFVVLFCVSWSVMAQDVIVKKDGSTILSKVMEINDAEIKYKKWSNQDGPVYSIKRVEVSSINYQNGEVEKYSDEVTGSSSTNEVTRSQSTNEVMGSQSNLDLPVYTGETLKLFDDRYYYLGEKLVTEEVWRTILGKEGIENYESAKRMYTTGKAFMIPAFIGMVVGGCGLVDGYVTDNINAKTIGYLGAGVGIPCFVLSRVFWNIGKNKASAVVTEYNSGVEKNKKDVSFQVSPSIMTSPNTQLQGNSCLGMTFSMNF